MRKLLLFASFLLPLLLSAQGQPQPQPQTQSPQPFIRAKLVPAENAIVGQPIRLIVEVLVPNYFTGAPDFPSFELDSAIVTLSDDRPEHLNEQHNGATFAGIRRFYIVVPEQPGKFSVPSFNLSVPYASKPPETSNASLTLPPLTFTAVLPLEAQSLGYFLPTTQLTIQQQWSVALTHLRVGDAVSRTVVVTAQMMQPMLIPPLQLTAPDGIRVYPKNPSVDSKKSPIGAFLAGVRTERASYLFTKPGDYTLPSMEISWWDLSAQKLKTSKLPAVKIHVEASDAYVSELPPEPPPQTAVQTPSRGLRDYLPAALKAALALLILAILAFLLHRLGPPLLRRITAARNRWQDSEPAFFRRLKQALQHNNAPRSYALLLAWIRRAYGDLSLSDFLQRAGDPRLDQQILALSRSLFMSPQPSTAWHDGSSLATTLSSHRDAAHLRGAPTKPDLPGLNPNLGPSERI
jgi:hypothetical protein